MDQAVKPNINYDKIGVEVEGDILFVTVAKYKLFMSYGSIGIDSFILYIHLMFTARMQKTNQVKANNIYLRQGLKWGKQRLSSAKNLLFDLGLIEDIQAHSKTGHFAGNYLKVKTRTTPFEIKSISTGGLETGRRVDRTPVSAHKCLNEKDKCLNEKDKCLNKSLDIKNLISEKVQEIFEYWNQLPGLQKHKLLNSHIEDIKKSLKNNTNMEIEEIKQCILLYSDIMSETEGKIYAGHKYKWSIGEFFKGDKGIRKFYEKNIEDFYDANVKAEIELDKKNTAIVKEALARADTNIKKKQEAMTNDKRRVYPEADEEFWA